MSASSIRASHMFLAGTLLIVTFGADLVVAHDPIVVDGPPALADPARAAEPGASDAGAADRAAAWDRLTGLSSGNVLVQGAGDWRPIDLDNRHGSSIVFECPDGSTATTSDDLAASQGDFVVPSCPYRVVDQPNPLGSPMIAVHPDHPDQVAFFSLHGNAIAGGPTERSRTGGSMTTFTSMTQGTSWNDQPLSRTPTGRSTGEFATGAFDRSGNIHIGYSWYTTDEDLQANGSIIWLMKAEPMQNDTSLSQREANVKRSYLWPVQLEYDDRYVGEVHMVRVDPAPDGSSRIDDANMTNRSVTSDQPRAPPSVREDYVTFGSADLAVPDRVVATWPVLVNGTNASSAETGYVDAAWTLSPTSDDWVGLADEERIGPCLGTGRPAAYYGKLFIPCIVGPGYDERAGARVGDIDIWSLDPYTGKTEWVAFTGIFKGKPLLASSPDGYMALITSGFIDDEPFATVSFGWYGTVWFDGQANLAKFFHRAAGDGRALDARVTAAAVSEDDHVVFLLYQERQQADVPQPGAFDPQHPPRPREYSKTVFAMNECDNILAASEIPLGDGMMEFHQSAYATSPGTYNDLQDGFAIARDPTDRQERVFFGINDYGSLLYGTIVVNEAANFCPITPPAVVGIGAGLPQALELGSGVGALTGAGVGVLAAAMVGYLLTVKRRTAHYTTADDE